MLFNKYIHQVSLIFSISLMLILVFAVQNSFAQVNLGMESSSSLEAELDSLAALARVTNIYKKSIAEGKSGPLTKQIYQENVDKFMQRMLIVSLRLKSSAQVRHFNQVRDYFADYEPRLAAQLPKASMSGNSSREPALHEHR